MPKDIDRFGDEDLDWLTIEDEEKEKTLMQAKEKQRIILRAKRALGQMSKSSASDKRIFMSQCISNMVESEGADEDDARDICEMLYEEGEEYE